MAYENLKRIWQRELNIRAAEEAGMLVAKIPAVSSVISRKGLPPPRKNGHATVVAPQVQAPPKREPKQQKLVTVMVGKVQMMVPQDRAEKLLIELAGL